LSFFKCILERRHFSNLSDSYAFSSTISLLGAWLISSCQLCINAGYLICLKILTNYCLKINKSMNVYLILLKFKLNFRFFYKIQKLTPMLKHTRRATNLTEDILQFKLDQFLTTVVKNAIEGMFQLKLIFIFICFVFKYFHFKTNKSN
jgi:hypothetical protein